MKGSKKRLRWKAGYRGLALIVLNTLVLLVVLNLGLAVVHGIVDAVRASRPTSYYVLKSYGKEKVFSAYSGYERDMVRDMLDEMWGRRMIYMPYTQFKEAPFSGEYVNVSEHGFRHCCNQAEWPPLPDNLNLMVFGGSTTFGYGVPDWETIPSYVQNALVGRGDKRVAVYNFGQGTYFSRQEQLLFQELLSSGVDIDVALFIDGLNEFEFRGLLDCDGLRKPPKRLLERLPMSRFAAAVQRRVMPRSWKRGREPRPPKPSIEATVERYMASKRMIRAVAESYGITVHFFWQPVPAYQFDQSMTPFPMEPERLERLRAGYEYAEGIRAQGEFADVVWCADLCQEVDPPHYVDQVHYSAGMHRAIAERIVAAISPLPKSKE